MGKNSIWNNNEYKLLIFIAFLFISILLFFFYNGINSFVFSRQKNDIMKKKNIILKEKMLERNENLFFNDYIDKEIYIEQQAKIISDLKGELKNVIDVCEAALKTEEKEFNILSKLKSNLSINSSALTIRFIIIKSLKGIKAITDFLSSKVYKQKEKYFLVLNKEVVDRKLKGIFLSFKDSSLNVLFNGFLSSVFNFVGYDVTDLLSKISPHMPI